MKTKFHAIKRAFYAVLGLALSASFLMPMLSSEALAYGQVTTRSVEMSSAEASDTNVSYNITFTPASSTTVQAIAVDFCSSDPLPGDACTLPAGFDLTATPTGTVNTTAGETLGTWAYSSVNNTTGYRTLELSDATAAGAPSGAFNFTVDTVTNPSSTGEFWARIFTFATPTDMTTTWNGTADGSDTSTILDAGGAALYINSTVSITAKIEEQLTFCVSGSTITGTCGGLTAPNLTLGHGSPTLALDSSQIDTAPAYTQLSTNANSGAQVRMKDLSSTTCGGLSKDSGSTCPVPAIGAEAAISSGAADFGMCVIPGGGTTADTPYSNISGAVCATTTPSGATVEYGMDDSTGGSTGNNVIGTYGSSIFHTAGAVNDEANTCDFAAQASNTTPAGIYTVNESLIATGTF
jgi:hypothetical protein